MSLNGDEIDGTTTTGGEAAATVSPAERSMLRERYVRPPLDFFDRLRRQTALLAVADAFAVAAPTRLHTHAERSFRDFTLASDQVLSVARDGDDTSLGWLRPIGSLVFLVSPACTDETVVENIAAALAAMNAVSVAVEDEQHERLHEVFRALEHFLPEAFVEIAVGPEAVYPPDATMAALLPGFVVFTNAAPVELKPFDGSAASRLERLADFSRLSQVDVPIG